MTPFYLQVSDYDCFLIGTRDIVIDDHWGDVSLQKLKTAGEPCFYDDAVLFSNISWENNVCFLTG